MLIKWNCVQKSSFHRIGDFMINSIVGKKKTERRFRKKNPHWSPFDFELAHKDKNRWFFDVYLFNKLISNGQQTVVVFPLHFFTSFPFNDSDRRWKMLCLYLFNLWNGITIDIFDVNNIESENENLFDPLIYLSS